MTLGQRIQQIRVAHALSQEQFGEKLGTTRQTVSRWELDQTYPELAKIVMISKLFSVTTDSILRDGISTFDGDVDTYSCGVYRSPKAEIVETEKFALVYYCNADKSILGTKLYMGFGQKKRLVAVCERDQKEKKTRYAYSDEAHTVIANAEKLSAVLGEIYDASAVKTMRRLERFSVDHSGKPLPRVSEAGIPGCLKKWRMSDSYQANAEGFHFYLCTGKTEYVFSIKNKDDNIYCGISYNIVFDLGLFGGGQFFRIRNYRDNTQPFCRFFCDFAYEPSQTDIPTEQCELGKCVETSKGLMWCVKRYTDDEIVLKGCGDDEYTYRRHDRRTEQFVKD